METFTSWIEKELNKRNWKPADLARYSGLSRTSISNVLNGNRKAGVTFCNAIANALNIPPEEVMTKANLLPQIKQTSNLRGVDREIFNELQTVGDDFKKAVLKTIKTWKLLYEELKEK